MVENGFRVLDLKSRKFFLNQLRDARLTAQKNAESFEGVIHVVERLGAYRLGDIQSLHAYREALIDLTVNSSLAADFSAEQAPYHTGIESLYELVKDARNSAVHQGARARHLTEHAIELALILEDAIMNIDPPMQTVSDVMVMNPVTAELWQPVSIVRQHMLINSFSHIPVQKPDKSWWLIGDHALVIYLRSVSKTERRQKLAATVSGAAGNGLELFTADCIGWAQDVRLLEPVSDKPFLVFAEDENGNPDLDRLVGLVAAFDIL